MTCLEYDTNYRNNNESLKMIEKVFLVVYADVVSYYHETRGSRERADQPVMRSVMVLNGQVRYRADYEQDWDGHQEKFQHHIEKCGVVSVGFTLDQKHYLARLPVADSQRIFSEATMLVVADVTPEETFRPK